MSIVGEVVPAREGLRLSPGNVNETDLAESERLFQQEKD